MPESASRNSEHPSPPEPEGSPEDLRGSFLLDGNIRRDKHAQAKKDYD